MTTRRKRVIILTHARSSCLGSSVKKVSITSFNGLIVAMYVFQNHVNGMTALEGHKSHKSIKAYLLSTRITPNKELGEISKKLT